MKGKKVLVTRAIRDNKKFREDLEKKGAEVVELPMIRFDPIEDLTTIHSYLNQLNTIDWIVFTSPQTVGHFFKIAEEHGVKFYFYPDLKIATVGEKTKLKLELLGYRTNFVPIKYTAEVLAENMDENISGKNILIPRSNIASDEYLNVFKARGATPLPVTIYKNQAVHYTETEIFSALDQQIDYLTFTSGSTYEAFHSNLIAHGIKLKDEKIICIGPSTAKVVEKLGGKVAGIAENHTSEGILEIIEKLENV